MDEDSPNGSPYEMLAKHDQSETKRDNGTIPLLQEEIDKVKDA
jgi:hypothetical protein